MSDTANTQTDDVVTAPGEVVADVEPQRTRPWLRWAVMGFVPLLLAAIAQRDKALLDVKRTVVRAPQDGVIRQTGRLQPGQLAITSVPALGLATFDKSWADADFKETQLARMHVGQPAEIDFDAMPGHKFRAHVIGIGAGTGSEFAVLPAQNATGNWVKVVRRVPGRLVLDEKMGRPLVAGLSAQVTVEIRR